MDDVILIKPEPISPLSSPEAIEEYKTTGETVLTKGEDNDS